MANPLSFERLSNRDLLTLKARWEPDRDKMLEKIDALEPKLEGYFDVRKYPADHEAWEKNRREMIAFFDQALEELNKEIDKRSKENVKNNPLYRDLEQWKSIPPSEIFIDDVINDFQPSKNNKSLLDYLGAVHNDLLPDDIAKLPPVQQAIAQKRLEELGELVDRGQRMKDAGYTPEYTDKVMRLTYDMCKDGLREVAKDVDLSNAASLFPHDVVGLNDDQKIKESQLVGELGWLNSENVKKGGTRQLGGREFKSFTEYVASKTTPEAFNAIEEANLWQGKDSYLRESCRRKYAVLKSMGYDFANYQDWDEAKKDLTASGFFVADRLDGMRRAFDELKRAPRKLDYYLEGQATCDAAIQVFLENANLPGVDKETDSMILLRTEKRDVLPKYKDGAKRGEVIDGNLTEAGFLSGVCESHSHITASMVTGDFLTVVRVPYSRVHSLWFMERGGITTSGDYVKRTDQPFDQGNFQFWAYHQNEIDACSQSLPIIKVGEVSYISETRKEAERTLTDWEDKNGKNRNSQNH